MIISNMECTTKSTLYKIGNRQYIGIVSVNLNNRFVSGSQNNNRAFGWKGKMKMNAMKRTKMLVVLALVLSTSLFAGTTVMQWGFDATSGAVTVPVTDDSGTGNDATDLIHSTTAPVYTGDIPTNTQFVTGIGSVDFTGTAGGLSTAASAGVGSGQGMLAAADVAAAGGFTMEVWVKNAVDNSSSGPAFALNMFGGHCLGVSDTDEGVKIGYFHGDNSNDLLWTTDYTTSGSWTHLAVVLKTTDPDGKVFTEVTSYVNGTAIYTGSVTLPWWLDRATSVANHQYGDWGDLEGLVYEPRISLGALEASEFTVVPEPATMLLLGLGSLTVLRRKK